MTTHEFEITIDKQGRVQVHMRGVKGRQCMEYAQWLERVVGPIAGQELTAEHYEPENGVRIDVCGRERR
ncbi:MAG: DUF2997 domain-containing protein [Planctomycetes bacterium]|nr:DUF2997 domain-containing protein [Planctomycetota bacterium]